MRILVKWYFNELLRYLTITFTSIPIIANEIANKNKPECIFSFIEMFFFYKKLLSKEKKMIFSSNHTILMKLYVGIVYNRP